MSKKDAKVCIRIQGREAKPTTSTVTTWTAVTGRILDLKEHLLNEHVTLVVMEATSDYWRPFYYLLEDEGLDVMLVNAREARNVPGRKTDVSDAAWLADLGAHGLVRASFVPPPPIRELRDLTRARTIITRERTREIQRLEKLLEDACIKLSSATPGIPTHTDAEIRTNVETNFLGPLFLARAFAPILSAKDKSAIIDIHSAMSWYAVGGIYSATKARPLVGHQLATPGARPRRGTRGGRPCRLRRHGDGCACHRPQDGPGRSGHHGIGCRRSR